MNCTQKIAGVRAAMKKHLLDALIVPSADSHNSEYVADAFKCRYFVSNFDGSAGTCVVTAEKALLWTDSRYWVEAAATKYPEFELMKDGSPDVPSYGDWLKKEMPNARVGIDAFLMTNSEWTKLSQTLDLVATDSNIVGDLMKENGGGKLPDAKAFARPAEFCGETVESKLDGVASDVREAGCDFVILSALDDIAWLLNLRGSDVESNPIFYSYAIVTSDGNGILFADAGKVDPSLLPSRITLESYGSLGEHLKAKFNGKTCSVDPLQISQGLVNLLTASSIKTKECKGFVRFRKSIKNERERLGFQECHVRDGAALTRYLAWLEEAILAGEAVDEVQGADVLEAYRREDSRFIQLSFPTISSSGPNGAVVHYRPEKKTARTISKEEVYLCDSGAHYYDGTTDVTRTVCFSTPDPTVVEAYTAVLQGHIAINSLVFPEGVTGHRIDAFARRALWGIGLDYGHGTGHGVGSFLNVHEGPQSIGSRPTPAAAPLKEHMVVSNEPGFYKPNAFGIRIENLELIVSKRTTHSERSLGFEALTMVPLEHKLINKAALTPDEISWVDKYHVAVKNALEPLLRAAKDERALKFLDKYTAPL